MPASTPSYVYDSRCGRFTPKNAMGAAAETLDKLHAAKEEAEKSGLYKKMQSGDPNELFDAAEQFGKVFTQLAEGALAPKKILPTYKMLVDESKPPLPEDAKALALEVAARHERLGCLAQAIVSHVESRRPIRLRACRGERDGHRPPRVLGRSPQPAATRRSSGSVSKGSTPAGKSSRFGASCPATTSKPKPETAPRSTSQPPSPSPGERARFTTSLMCPDDVELMRRTWLGKDTTDP